MKEMSFAFEKTLWQQSYPSFFDYAVRGGIFIIPDLQQLMKQIAVSGVGDNEIDRALLRLDLSMSILWPKVKDLFVADFFPHRLAAATDLLHAVDFVEEPDKQINELAIELAASLDNIEDILERHHYQEEAVLKAAEEFSCGGEK
jgi:hypothetical protein